MTAMLCCAVLSQTIPHDRHLFPATVIVVVMVIYSIGKYPYNGSDSKSSDSSKSDGNVGDHVDALDRNSDGDLKTGIDY